MPLDSGRSETTSEATPPPLPHDRISTQPVENPPWSAWDVVLIVLVMFGTLLFSLLAVTFVVKRVAFARVPFMQVMSFPLVAFAAQMMSYLLTMSFMFTTATRNTGKAFAANIHWNWPRSWPVYILLGVGFCAGLQFLAGFLPMPHKIEMEVFFQTPLRAWVLSIFAMSLVPIFEEMFFRGFLYPVLARRLGLILAVLFTSIAFASIHVPQLADPHMPLATSWGPILIIFIIGLALTIIRAVKRSVAAGVLVHMAYNGFTSILAMVATGGFRHLDRIAQ